MLPPWVQTLSQESPDRQQGRTKSEQDFAIPFQLPEKWSCSFTGSLHPENGCGVGLSVRSVGQSRECRRLLRHLRAPFVASPHCRLRRLPRVCVLFPGSSSLLPDGSLPEMVSTPVLVGVVTCWSRIELRSICSTSLARPAKLFRLCSVCRGNGQASMAVLWAFARGLRRCEEHQPLDRRLYSLNSGTDTLPTNGLRL